VEDTHWLVETNSIIKKFFSKGVDKLKPIWYYSIRKSKEAVRAGSTGNPFDIEAGGMLRRAG